MLAILLLSFGATQAADSIAVSIYDVTNDVVLDPTTDTIYTQDAGGVDLQYHIRIAIESDLGIYGMSLGFRFWSDDGVVWQYDAQVGGEGTSEAVTVMVGSRLDPPGDAFDLGGLQVTETDVDGMLDDTVLFGGISLEDSLDPGPLEDMLNVHLTLGGVGFGETKTFCVDSAFVPPAGNWIIADAAGTTTPPLMGPALCIPVSTLNPNDLADDKKAVPHVFDLAQNYPNPFNPATVIKYSVARKTHVNIAIYNILGQNVVTLVNEEKDAGAVHEVVWDGNDNNGEQVASGIYFYKMHTTEFVETRKMALMR
jgi:hypothetical protein